MPPRHRLTLVELIIIAAVIGVLASIALPALRQAGPRAAREQAALQVREPPPDGQLNTIEVPEVSEGARPRPSAARQGPSDDAWAALAVAVAAVAVIGMLRRRRARPRG